MSKIVVGVDASPHSAAALEWAVAEARIRSAEVVAVAAWEPPVLAASAPSVLSVGLLGDALINETERQLKEVVASVDARGVEVQTVVDYGNAARVLLDQARDADLLVVGARGYGGFKGLLMGSVSQQCATHAVCPTVIVPSRPHDRSGEAQNA